MPLPSITLPALDLLVGEELGVSEWMLVDQDRIDAFANCTGDMQWIHVDAERARQDGPFGGTVAHGFLTLATLGASALEVFLKPAGVRAAVNYGLERVRFVAPVRSGSRIRTRIRLLGAVPRDGSRWMVTTENTVEIEGGAKPALVAQSLLLVEM